MPLVVVGKGIVVLVSQPSHFDARFDQCEMSLVDSYEVLRLLNSKKVREK